MTQTSRLALIVGTVALVVSAGVAGAGMVAGGDGAGSPQTAAGGPNERTLTVAASGTAEAEPDRAVVRLSIESTADDPSVARRRVAENASSMRAALSDLGLAESAVRTTGFDIYEDRERPPQPGGEPVTTYRARHTFAVEVDDTDRVGAVIDAAIEAGATGIHGVRFTLTPETRDELRTTAIQRAMSEARHRADAMADSAGLAVTDVAAARTGDVGGPRPNPVVQTARAEGGGTSIESGPVTVTATVRVTYNATG